MSEWTPPVGYEKLAKKPPKREAPQEVVRVEENSFEVKAREKISTLKKQIQELEIIGGSLRIWRPRGSDPEQYGEQIRDTKEGLIKKHLEEETPQEDIELAESELRKLEFLKNEQDVFYAEMNENISDSRHLQKDRHKEQELENAPEEFLALLKKLETLGIPLGSIRNQAKHSTYPNLSDSRILESVVSNRIFRLQQEVNQERLSLPGEREKMVAELLKRGKFIEEAHLKKVEEAFARGVRAEQYANAESIVPELLPLRDDYSSWYIHQYPVEVQRGVVEFLSKKSLEESRHEFHPNFIQEVTNYLGQYLEEYRRFQSLPDKSDVINYDTVFFSFEKGKKLLERTKAVLEEEERYITRLLKADISIEFGKNGFYWHLDHLGQDNPPKKIIWPLEYGSFNQVREKSEEDKQVDELVWKEEGIVKNILNEKFEKKNNRPLAEGYPIDTLELITAIRARIATTEEHLLELDGKQKQWEEAQQSLKQRGQQRIDFNREQVEDRKAA